MRMKAPIVRITSAVAVLLLAVALLAFGMKKNHKVYDADSDDFGMLTFRKISDSDLFVDTEEVDDLQHGVALPGRVVKPGEGAGHGSHHPSPGPWDSGDADTRSLAH